MDKLENNNRDSGRKGKKRTFVKLYAANRTFATGGDSANHILMQIEEELNKTNFNTNSTNDKIRRYAEQIVLITDQIYLGKLECFTVQRLAHILGVGREYLHQLARADFENSKILKKAIENFRLAIADNLTMGGVTKKYSEGFSRHLLSFYDSEQYEHEKVMAMLKQLESTTAPIQVILNKPSVTGKHKPECGDTEPDGGF